MPEQQLHNPAFLWLSRTGRISPLLRGGLVLVAFIPMLTKGGLETRGVRGSAFTSALTNLPVTSVIEGYI